MNLMDYEAQLVLFKDEEHLEKERNSMDFWFSFESSYETYCSSFSLCLNDIYHREKNTHMITTSKQNIYVSLSHAHTTRERGPYLHGFHVHYGSHGLNLTTSFLLKISDFGSL
ncbi:hypothetical protein Hanom_Chr01g00070921 [Helianthus anomalus]